MVFAKVCIFNITPWEIFFFSSYCYMFSSYGIKMSVQRYILNFVALKEGCENGFMFLCVRFAYRKTPFNDYTIGTCVSCQIYFRATIACLCHLQLHPYIFKITNNGSFDVTNVVAYLCTFSLSTLIFLKLDLLQSKRWIG